MYNASRTYNTTSQHGPDTTNPRTIDWAQRQANALIPFDVVDGLPQNPITPDLPAGRGDLWHWGEAVAADVAALGVDDAGERRLLMVERADGHGWALPGGMLDPGETPATAAVRELGEETGLDGVAPSDLIMLPARGVPDPRAGAHAWMVTCPTVVQLDGDLLPVRGLDDARQARWVPATSYEHLVNALVDGAVFKAHDALVREILGTDLEALAGASEA